MRLSAALVLLAAYAAPGNLWGQSLTAGSLRGAVITRDGEPVPGAEVALEASDGGTILILETSRFGEFAVSLLAPGTYRILVEQIGFQPVRRLGVTVRAGQATSVTIAVERRPPPITAVVETEGASTSSGFSGGRLVAGSELTGFDARRDGTDVSRGVSEVVSPMDGRQGFALAALGLQPAMSRFFVDGVPEPLLRHPGLPAEPATSPLFARDGLDQVQIIHSGLDAEWRGTSGTILTTQSRRGGNRASIQPWARFSSASLGGSSELNPADSGGSSFGVGAAITGAIVPDTAHFFLRGEYQSHEMPTAFPWASDVGRFGGSDVSIRESIASIGSVNFSTPLGAAVDPVVRTWKGGDVAGRLDWQLSPRNAVMVRAGFATWKERQPLLGRDAANDAGSGLDARDFSGAVTLTSLGESSANEFRAGFNAARREWLDAGLPATTLANEGVRIGGNAGLPGLFDQKTLSLGDAIQIRLARHSIKVGASLDYTSHEQAWSHGSAGVFHFGDLDRFAGAQGTYFRTTGATAGAKFSSTEVGVFVEDAWAVAPDLQLLLGARYQTQSVPANKLGLNQAWLDASGISSNIRPEDRSGIGPRAGFVWDVQNRGEWIVRGSGGLFHSGLVPARFAEAVLGTVGLSVVRAQGTLDWPTPPVGSLTGSAARLAMFTEDYKAPRTFKAEAGITRAMANGFTVQLGGGYYHSDFLLRRLNLNRLPSAIASTNEGRPVFGTLVKQGGLLQAEPGSNRRFDEFDLVSSFVPNGFSDHYELTAALERRVTRALSLLGSYTFSRSRDNLIGAIEADPFDQLSPFPGGLNGLDWDEGRSDFDIPHRLAATLEYRGAGSTPVLVSARWRWRSGLPFTPGFRPGVDANADGGSSNDPAFLDAGLSGLASALSQLNCSQSAVNQFAERNGCREKSVQGLDIGARITLPVTLGAERRLALSLDAFNVVSTTTGVIDRALLLVDPAATLGAPVGGQYSLPLLANPNFGTILSRRGEPRLLRIGLGIDY